MPTLTLMAVDEICRDYVPSSHEQPWSWEDEERELLTVRIGCCIGERCSWPERHLDRTPGAYQLAFEEYIKAHGFPTESGVVLGKDGRVWDGHHRIVAARRLGLTHVPVETYGS